MRRLDPDRPMRMAYVVGTFSAHPGVMGAMNEFLHWAIEPGTVRGGIRGHAYDEECLRFEENHARDLGMRMPVALNNQRNGASTAHSR